MRHKRVTLGLLFVCVMSIGAVTAQGTDAVAIMLERTACHGMCPIYRVTIFKDGTVNYSGDSFVEVAGEQTSMIEPETVQQMIDAFQNAGYFEWDDAYDTETVSDLASVITSVTRDGETKRITHYVGDTSAPLALPFLEQWIDEMVNTQVWTGVQPDPSAISNGTDTAIITLQHEACFGLCPVYNVALFADGTVVFSGVANVDSIGVVVLEMDEASVTGIAELAQIFGYFDWQDSYDQPIVTEQATVITSIRWDDQYKQIVRNDGDPDAPIGLVRLEASMEQLVANQVSTRGQ